MDLLGLDGYFRSILRIDEFEKFDSSLNGIQVGRSDTPIRRVAFAVDACEESFRAAAQWGADVLCVHHGLFWGKEQRVLGILWKRIKYLLDHDLALYAVHLPLDADLTIGNNMFIAKQLQLQNIVPFGVYRGIEIGVQGNLPIPMDLPSIARKLFGSPSSSLGVLPFGSPQIQSIAIVSGRAASEALQAIDKKIDLFITGEPSHSIFHACVEGGLNVIFGGHYKTETGGVQEWERKTARDTELETQFFDIPTGF